MNQLKIDPDSKMEFLNGLSIFETVLLRPNSPELIEICLQNKSSFFEVNQKFSFVADFFIKTLFHRKTLMDITEFVTQFSRILPITLKHS